jgi:hypothetical protein
MLNHPTHWDHCELNLKYGIGFALFNSVRRFRTNEDKEELGRIAATMFRFLVEVNLEAFPEVINNELFNSYSFIWKNRNLLGDASEDIEDSMRNLPVLLLKFYLYSKEKNGYQPLRNLIIEVDQKNWLLPIYSKLCKICQRNVAEQ